MLTKKKPNILKRKTLKKKGKKGFLNIKNETKLNKSRGGVDTLQNRRHTESFFDSDAVSDNENSRLAMKENNDARKDVFKTRDILLEINSFVGNGRTLLTGKEIERDPSSITHLKKEVWNGKVNQCSAFMKVPDLGLVDLKYSPDGKRLLTIGWDCAWIWDTTTGELIMNTDDKARLMETCDYSHDGKKMATASITFTGKIKIWDSDNGKLLKTIHPNFKSNNIVDETIRKVMFSPDDKNIIFVSPRGVTCYELDTGKDDIFHEIPHRVNEDDHKLRISPDGEILLDWDHTRIKLVWLKSNNLSEIRSFVGYRLGYGIDFKHDIAFSPDSTLIAVESNIRNEIHLLNVHTGNLQLTLKCSERPFPYSKDSEDYNSAHPIVKFLFSLDGMFLVTFNTESINLFNIQTGTLVASNKFEMPLWVTKYAISPDGKNIAMITEYWQVRILNLENMMKMDFTKSKKRI
jgi:hypothetical protein